MKIAFITPSVSRAIGGIFEIERRLSQTLTLFPGTEVSVYGLQDEDSARDLPFWRPVQPRTFGVSGPRVFGYSRGLQNALLSDGADVAHLHALWMFTSVVTHRWHRKFGRPYVVTPNGMLDPWALRNSAWKKRIAFWLYERRMLADAACLQANTEKEAADFRALGLKNPIAIIPNGIDVPEIGGQRMEDGRQVAAARGAPWGGLIEPGRKVLLFLSRIHPKKGLVSLIKAWAAVRRSEDGRRRAEEWVLAIAGWDQGGHEMELKNLCDELEVGWQDLREHSTFNVQHPTSNRRFEGGRRSSAVRTPPSVVFLGPQFGADKAACYANCYAFILPSFSEGVPMVVLEAWVHGKPVLMTPECNLSIGFNQGAAIRIETGAESIAQGLRELFEAPASALDAMGESGRVLATSQFSWPRVAEEMKRLYVWLLGGGDKPACIADF